MQTDICLVGAGAAGIAIAREFLGHSLDVTLIESGGEEPTAENDALKQGENIGLKHTGLTEGRNRLFGGTTRSWGGQCLPMEEIDFESRPWVPESGWPISKADLNEYYTRAEAFFGVSGEVYDERVWDRFKTHPKVPDPTKLQYRSTVWCPKPDMGKLYKKEIEHAKNVRVLLNANVIRVVSNESRSAVEQVVVRAANGVQATISARAVVLCCGGIENPRILLLSDGLGNERDLVGRYFQEHPNTLSAEVKTDSPKSLQNAFALLYRRRFRYLPKLCLAPEAQREHSVMNCASNLTFEFDERSAIGAAKRIYRTVQKGGRPQNLLEELQLLAVDGKNLVPTVWRRYVKGLSTGARPSSIWLQTHAEQAPNRDSRITLSDEVDQLGLRRARVDWRLGELDRRTAEITTQIVCEQFRELGFGRLVIPEWLTDSSSDWANRFSDSYHHMGTTRMGDCPSSSVVDRDCQVHGVGGLFVAGSSVFPTSSYANPTLTIVALAIRLSDHLKKQCV